jgi:tRNA acetyltransferase TAN1
MLSDFNLLTTTYRRNENEACSELLYLLGQTGDLAPAVDKTGVAGLIVAKTAFNPFEVVDSFRKILHERPYEFRYTLRVIPIERVVRTDLVEIQRVATALGSKIGENESFRVTVEKRFTEISSRDIVEAAAMNIEREVDLNEPNRILLVEIIGGLAGVSMIKPDDILSVVKEKLL